MKKLLVLLLFIPFISKAQFVTQGICTQSGGVFTLNGISQTPYAGRFFSTTALNLNNNFDLKFDTYLGHTFNNGMAFLLVPGPVPTATTPALVINTDNIHNFGTGSINTDFVIEFDVRGSFCVAGQNTLYEPTTDINHIAYWKNNSSCAFGNYYSQYSALGPTVNYYAYEPYRIKWTKSTNTLETYYNNALIKTNVVDLVGLLGTTAYWGFSAACYCVTGGPAVGSLNLNGTFLVPLHLTGFNAEKNNGSVKLMWQTAMEQNTSHFNIEKSYDGRNFSFIQRVEAAGNSNVTKNYNATDASPVYGTGYYRLKMIDSDGRFTYSKVVAVTMHEKGGGINIFPNPVDKELQLQIPADKKETARIQIQDATGKTVHQQDIQLNGTAIYTSVEVAALKPGVYMLVVTRSGQKEVKKFIKQ